MSNPAYEFYKPDVSNLEATGVETPEAENATVAETRPINFVDEIDAWARHSVAANGFGDWV